MTYMYDVKLGEAVIYVGITASTKRRLMQHKHSGLVPRAATIHEVAKFETRAEAMKAESARIEEQNPPLNLPSRATDAAKKRLDRRKAVLHRFGEIIEIEAYKKSWDDTWKEVRALQAACDHNFEPFSRPVHGEDVVYCKKCLAHKPVNSE